MMHLEQAQAIVARVTYKPGWKIKLITSPSRGDYAFLYVSATFPDVQHPDTPILVARDVAITGIEIEIWTEQMLLRRCYDVICSLEVHEASEWFKVDGVAILNEHDVERRQLEEISERMQISLDNNSSKAHSRGPVSTDK
jgi:hypothetical protein